MDDECPICLEPLTGTIVHMSCCGKKVHIQCYLPKCPMCRSNLPLPRSTEVMIPIPIPVHVQAQPLMFQKTVAALTLMTPLAIIFFLYGYQPLKNM
jgi:hypothetical protein